jgi:hypothetical protein
LDSFFARLHGFSISGTVSIQFDLVPAAPRLTGVTFHRGTLSMAAKGLTHFDTPADPGVARKIQVTLNGAAPVEIDVTDPTVEFDCNEGDSYSITATDTNATGTGPASPALTGTVPSFPPPPPPLPAAPPLSSVSFRAA